MALLFYGIEFVHFLMMAVTQLCLVLSLFVVFSLSRKFTKNTLKSFGISFLLGSSIMLNLGHLAHFLLYLPRSVYGGMASSGSAGYVDSAAAAMQGFHTINFTSPVTLFGLPPGLVWVYAFHVFVLLSAIFITLAAFRLKKLGDEFGLNSNS